MISKGGFLKLFTIAISRDIHEILQKIEEISCENAGAQKSKCGSRTFKPWTFQLQYKLQPWSSQPQTFQP